MPAFSYAPCISRPFPLFSLPSSICPARTFTGRTGTAPPVLASRLQWPPAQRHHRTDAKSIGASLELPFCPLGAPPLGLHPWGSTLGAPPLGLHPWGSTLGAPPLGLHPWGSTLGAPPLGLHPWGSTLGAPPLGLHPWGSTLGAPPLGLHPWGSTLGAPPLGLHPWGSTLGLHPWGSTLGAPPLGLHPWGSTLGAPPFASRLAPTGQGATPGIENAGSIGYPLFPMTRCFNPRHRKRHGLPLIPCLAVRPLSPVLGKSRRAAPCRPHSSRSPQHCRQKPPRKPNLPPRAAKNKDRPRQHATRSRPLFHAKRAGKCSRRVAIGRMWFTPARG